MNNHSIADELDEAIEQMLAAPDAVTTPGSQLGDLVDVAAELRDLPRANFKARLLTELEWEAAGRTVSVSSHGQQRELAAVASNTASLPGLFGKTWSGYPVRRGNMALSFALHALMVMAVGAGWVAVKSMKPQIFPDSSVSVRLEPVAFPVGSSVSHGGGSGGATERTPANLGAAPRAAREQLTPPLMVRNMRPQIVAEATIVAPPELAVPRTREIGDPLSLLTLSSAGPGVSNGIGGRSGGGMGDGEGPGRGHGTGGGCCDGVYAPGSGVTMPKAIYAPEPEFSEEARKLKHQGDVVLLATIGADGLAHNLKVVRSLGMGLDEKALEKVPTWRFEPARKDGHPVAVQINIIVNFRLY